MPEFPTVLNSLIARSAKVAATAAAINLARATYSFELRHGVLSRASAALWFWHRFPQPASPPACYDRPWMRSLHVAHRPQQRAVSHLPSQYHTLSQCLFLGGLEGLSAQTVRSYLKTHKSLKNELRRPKGKMTLSPARGAHIHEK